MALNDKLKEFSWLSEYYCPPEYSEFPETLDEPDFSMLLLNVKTYGFSDSQIARAFGLEKSMNMERIGLAFCKWRRELEIRP